MKIQAFTKYIDQPIVINKIQKAFPAILCGSALAGGVIDTLRTPKEKRSEKGTKNAIILSSTVLASLVGARGLKVGKKQIIKGLMPMQDTKQIIESHKKAIEEYLKKKPKISQAARDILNTKKEAAFSVKETDVLLKDLPKNADSKKLFNNIFSAEAQLTSKGLFEDMKRLPLYGAYAILGGLAGGLAADKVTGTASKKSTANKVKEAVYQYFANTFLCIMGAGAALAGLEKLESKGIVKNVTPAKKMATVIGGIVGVGVLFGSVAANVIGKKIVNPLFGQTESPENSKNIYSERRPEVLDLCIHVDDLATAGVYSGFRWIEAVMPACYLLAGYRAGIGHRNNKEKAQ